MFKNVPLAATADPPTPPAKPVPLPASPVSVMPTVSPALVDSSYQKTDSVWNSVPIDTMPEHLLKLASNVSVDVYNVPLTPNVCHVELVFSNPLTKHVSMTVSKQDSTQTLQPFHAKTVTQLA